MSMTKTETFAKNSSKVKTEPFNLMKLKTIAKEPNPMSKSIQRFSKSKPTTRFLDLTSALFLARIFANSHKH